MNREWLAENPAHGVDHVVGYWKSLAPSSNDGLPARRAFDPGFLTDRNARLSIMRRRGRYDVTGGLINRDLVDVWQRPVVGINTFDLASPDMRENLAKFYDAILTQPCGALLAEKCPPGEGPAHTLTSLYLPMCDRSGKAAYVIGITRSETPGFQGGLSNQLVLSHCQIEAVKFIDLGHGVADVSFEAPRPGARATFANRKSWWDRFMPLSAKAEQQRENA